MTLRSNPLIDRISHIIGVFAETPSRVRSNVRRFIPYRRYISIERFNDMMNGMLGECDADAAFKGSIVHAVLGRSSVSPMDIAEGRVQGVSVDVPPVVFDLMESCGLVGFKMRGEPSYIDFSGFLALSMRENTCFRKRDVFSEYRQPSDHPSGACVVDSHSACAHHVPMGVF